MLGTNELNMWDGCTKSLLSICQEISNLNNAINDPENTTYGMLIRILIFGI